jgi:sec-independent protein translocase protein TatA
MFGLGMPELLVILIIIMIIFGAGKLPQIGSGIGKGIKNFKKAIHEGSDDIKNPPKELNASVERSKSTTNL